MSTKNFKITVNGVEVPSKKIGIDEAKRIVGWREAKKGEEDGYTYVGPNGKGKFVLDNNKSNRPFKLSLAKRYMWQMLRGEWAGQWNSASTTHNGETGVIDSEGGIISCVHRLVAVILADLERQRLEALSDGPDSPAAKKLAESGCEGPIEIDLLLVEGVDPRAADTADIGKPRTLGDVVYRRHQFDDQEISSSVEARLSRELAVAIRLVWLRLQGLQISRGPKGEVPELVTFPDRHPLLKQALLHIYKVDGGPGKDGRRISGYITLGNAAALMYLAAFSKSDRESYENGTLDLTSKPERWDEAAEFWTLFADDLHSEENPIKALHTLLEKQRGKKALKFSRDTPSTLVARAFKSWIGEVDDWSTVKLLASKLDTKDGNVLRFGGLDLDRQTLQSKGFVQSDEPVVRIHSGEWRVGDKVLVVGSKWEPWTGTIESFTDDGKTARVIDDDDFYVDCDIEWLKSGNDNEAHDE